jgi:hypothetical protein
MISLGTPEARYKRARLKTEAAATGQMRKEPKKERPPKNRGGRYKCPAHYDAPSLR